MPPMRARGEQEEGRYFFFVLADSSVLLRTDISHGSKPYSSRTINIRITSVVPSAIRSPMRSRTRSPWGPLAKVVFLLVTPLSEPEVHHSADIARIFRDPHCLERVLRASTFTEYPAKFIVFRKRRLV